MTNHDHYDISQEWEDFYASLGLALSRWNHVEHTLFEIFVNFMACPSWHAASAVYYSIQNAKARLDMLEAAAPVALGRDTEEFKRWRSLAIRVADKAAIRNKLTHYIVVTHAEQPAKKRVGLEPALLDVRPHYAEKRRAQRSRWTLEDVKAFDAQFRRLNGELLLFCRSRPPVKEQIQAALSQSDDASHKESR